MLADALRTDLHKFRSVALDEPLIIQIREISRADEYLREEANRLVNRFREQVQRCAPHILSLCPAADEPWFWDLVERFTAPGTRVTRLQAQKLLARHRIRRLSAEAILATLNEERLRIAPGAAEATRSHILLLLPRLCIAHDQRKACAKQLKNLLAERGPGVSPERCRSADVASRSRPRRGASSRRPGSGNQAQWQEPRGGHALCL